MTYPNYIVSNTYRNTTANRTGGRSNKKNELSKGIPTYKLRKTLAGEDNSIDVRDIKRRGRRCGRWNRHHGGQFSGFEELTIKKPKTRKGVDVSSTHQWDISEKLTTKTGDHPYCRRRASRVGASIAPWRIIFVVIFSTMYRFLSVSTTRYSSRSCENPTRSYSSTAPQSTAPQKGLLFNPQLLAGKRAIVTGSTSGKEISPLGAMVIVYLVYLVLFHRIPIMDRCLSFRSSSLEFNDFIFKKNPIICQRTSC